MQAGVCAGKQSILTSHIVKVIAFINQSEGIRRAGAWGQMASRQSLIFLSCKMSLMGCFDKHATVSLQTTALCPFSCTNKPPPLPPQHTQTLRRPILTIFPSVYTSDRSQRALWVQWSQWSSVIVNTTLITLEQLGATFISYLLTSRETIEISVIFSGLFYSRQYFRFPHISKKNGQLINDNKKTSMLM